MLLQLIIMGTAIAIPLIQHNYVNPSFERLIVKNSEVEALRVGHSLQRYIIEDATSNSVETNTYETLESHFTLTPEVESYLNSAVIDFNLWRIKIFNRSGIVIYSTNQKDISEVNNKPYFKNLLSRGLPYTKTEYLIDKNSESTKPLYLVETYVPIILKNGEFIGAFEIYYDITDRKDELIFLTTEIMTVIIWLSLLSFMLAIIMGRVLNRLRESRTSYEESLLAQATEDKLTGVFNRHSIDEYLEFSVMKFYDEKVDHCLVMFDVDHFKQVNDTYGHQAGDDVLTNLASIVQDRVRDTDIVGRYGGEEFIIILPKTGAQGGNAFAESLRRLVEETPISTSAGELHITISLGVGSFCDIEDLTPHTLVKKVDEAMYAAKHAGRNRSTYVRT